ncbi:MAG: N-6 DNA methylase [Lentisphaeria bacterium]|nr:N-6 DNA methylase [Lentisphaeria bacterium]
MEPITSASPPAPRTANWKNSLHPPSHGMNASEQLHLNSNARINLGSFYTPEKYVRLVAKWLDGLIDDSFKIVDPSCGYGAFFALKRFFPRNTFIGNDIDPVACDMASRNFPFAKLTCRNALLNVGRKPYGLKRNDRIVIVGNPPYNDTTSQISQRIKGTSYTQMDDDVKARDIGMASLKADAKLRADFVAVLHPLSYIIKKSNHAACKSFFKDYTLKKHLIFNSQEFNDTSKIRGFPVIVALYERTPGHGLSYADVLSTTWRTVEGNSFRLDDMDFVTDNVRKYPSATQDAQENSLFFYTLRDINALKRSKTFVSGNTRNSVAVAPESLDYYCYIDCFKRYADVPYYLGNLNVPYIKKDFNTIREICRKLAMHNNSELFGKDACVTPDEFNALVDYIKKTLSTSPRKKGNS